MEPVTILTFDQKEHADAACRQLEAAGLHPVLDDESAKQKRWLVGECHACYHVQVDKSEHPRAQELLGSWGDAHVAILAEAVRCPECGSSEIEYPQYNRQFKLEPAVLAMLATVGLVEKKFYCLHCQYTWPLQEKVDGPRDILGWPKKKASTPVAGNPAGSSRQ